MDLPFPETMLDNIRRFFREKHPATVPGEDIYPDVFDNEGFFPLQRPRELAQMVQAARELKPFAVMEIGCDKGGGLYHLIQGMPTVGKAIGCEIRGTPYASEFMQAFPDVSFCWLPRSSLDGAAFAAVQKALGNDPLDVLFIDGDKSRFLDDFNTYSPLVRDGGIVFMHDIKDRSPREAFEAAKKHPRVKRFREIIDITDSNEACARETAGFPAANAHEGWLRHWRGASCGVGVMYL
jgi:predicted O-methyltransferase YrrM